MSALILTGKEPAQKLLDGLRDKVEKLDPKLVIVQVGDDASSASYIRKKMESTRAIGMRSEHLHLPSDTSFEALVDTVRSLNDNPDVSAFLVQSPLPKHLHSRYPEVMREVDPKKDADGFTAYNVGKMFLSAEYEHLAPATASAVIEMLSFYAVPVEGKHVVIVGRSNIVGKPLAVMLINRGATVTVCNSKTKDLGAITSQADILISAVGKPKLITVDMVKKGAVVIDVGITRDEEGLKGDVDFETVNEIASAISPVPGGVGPLTVACLLRNCVRAKERQ